MKKKLLKNLLWGGIVIVVILTIWLIAFAITKNELLVPSISSTLSKLFEYLGSSEFYKSFIRTIIRSLIAFIISFILALLCSVLSFKIKAFKNILSPLISIIRSIPTMAITLLLLIYFSPKSTPVVITLLVLFPMLYAQFNTAYNSINPKYFELAKIYKISSNNVIKKIILPNIAPSILDNMGSNLSFGLKLTISAEVLAKTYNSLGYMLNDAKMYGETAANMFALTLLTLLTALLIEFIFYIISINSFKKWRVRNDQDK